MFAELLLEIGTEEIPSDYLVNGLRALKGLAEGYLRDNRIEVTKDLCTHGTPRRLVLFGEAVAHRQDDVTQEVTGPPKRAAFDEKGNPTKAALGFARKQGVTVDDLKTLETPKGEYLYVKRKIPGKTAIEVLSEIVPKMIGDIPWPKSMRWGREGFPFVRPIHWVLAMLNGEVIPFEVAGVKSGNLTRGHRFMAPHVMEISGLQDYLKKMKQSFVVIDRKEREGEVEKVVMKAAGVVSGSPMKDPELVTTVANLVEFPSAICGSFDDGFLRIPDSVLITAMKKHQKYFALRDGEDRLMPNFVAVNNTVARDESVVQRGLERVLRARLADADFFFREDRKRPLEDRLDDLKNVIYQAELGTSFAKVERFTSLAVYLAEKVAPEKINDVTLAARLCKCDLVTEMVMEFPSLQGVMGEEYARMDGHPEEVCRAIHEHYLPARSGDELPATPLGAIVGVADRMDTITGCFAIQLEPTGTADPFALRRHALAITRIMEKMAWDVSIQELVSTSLSILNEAIEFECDPVFLKVIDFFRERYRNMMLSTGYKSDLIEAVISVAFDHIDQIHSRIDQLQKFITASEEFESLVLTFKRITNILKKQEETHDVDPGLFKESCEFKLWEVVQEVRDEIIGLIERKAYFEALNLLAQLRQPVDNLFDGVEIMTKENPRLRDNRVGMLQYLARLFLSLADFSKFSI